MSASSTHFDLTGLRLARNKEDMEKKGLTQGQKSQSSEKERSKKECCNASDE